MWFVPMPLSLKTRLIFQTLRGPLVKLWSQIIALMESPYVVNKIPERRKSLPGHGIARV